jgi:hypothetical protein
VITARSTVGEPMPDRRAPAGVPAAPPRAPQPSGSLPALEITARTPGQDRAANRRLPAGARAGAGLLPVRRSAQAWPRSRNAGSPMLRITATAARLELVSVGPRSPACADRSRVGAALPWITARSAGAAVAPYYGSSPGCSPRRPSRHIRFTRPGTMAERPRGIAALWGIGPLLVARCPIGLEWNWPGGPAGRNCHGPVRHRAAAADKRAAAAVRVPASVPVTARTIGCLMMGDRHARHGLHACPLSVAGSLSGWITARSVRVRGSRGGAR